MGGQAQPIGGFTQGHEAFHVNLSQLRT
jgi:hypothetical protein